MLQQDLPEVAEDCNVPQSTELVAADDANAAQVNEQTVGASEALRQLPEVDVDFNEEEKGLVGSRISSKLTTQGFCTVNMGMTVDTLRKAHKSVRQIDRLGSFERPPLAVSNGLLGRGSAALAELEATDRGVERPESEGLAELARAMDGAGDCLGPYMEGTSFAFSHRTCFMLHRAGSMLYDDEDLPITDAAARRWEPIFSHQRVLVAVFLGPGNAVLELKPHESMNANPLEVPMLPGSMVLVRPDVLACKLNGQERSLTMVSMYITVTRSKVVAPVALELDDWIMQLLEVVKERQTEDNCGLWSSDLPREWQLRMNHSFYRGNYIPVMGSSIKVPSTYDSDAWASVSTAGGDVIREVPISRWDLNEYFDPDLESWQQGKSYCSHAGFAEGLQLFDAMFFAMSPAEASWTAPHQRMVLDCGYQALQASGYTRKSLMGSRIAHISGFGSLQWNFIDKSELGSGGAYGACGEAASIMAARLSYCFGMKGNCFTVDTEGSSGLTALHGCCDAIQDRGRGTPDSGALATAAFINLTPMMWPRQCAAGFLSVEGRCFAFSDRADGYVQTDGVAACVVKSQSTVDGDDEELDLGIGVIAAMSMNHNGTGASLHAPRGPSEQEIVLEVAQNAMISTLDVDAVECHGAGAYLADAIEINSMMRAHRSEEHNEPLGTMSEKTNQGNSVWTAGLTAFLKVLWNAQRDVMNPLVHMHSVNPHIEVMDGGAALLSTEAVRFRSQIGSYTGTMSRGFGGTNVYVISRGAPPEEYVEEELPSYENMLSYWPGGGGVLDLDSLPSEGYHIAGSFNDWKGESMDKDSSGAFTHTVTLTDDGLAEFQIWLDGDFHRVLHPGWPQALSDAPVFGPTYGEQASGYNWVILTDDSQPGKPGDQYQVSLHISGRWRSVSWTKA